MILNRRSFLRALGLSGAGVLFGRYSAARPVKIFEQGTGVRVSGSVKSQGKGLHNVAVSDGYSVVLTDPKGAFQLDTSPQAEFVFVSSPKGYELPHEKGITNFFRRVSGTSMLRADFELTKLNVDDTRHKFIVWADPQIETAEDAKKLHAQSVPDTRDLVNAYPKDTLFHGIGCGDLIWDNFDLFPEYKSAVEKVGIPFFQVIGNHDMDLDARTDDVSAATFKNHFGPTYYSFNRGDVHYVVLDDVFFLGPSKRYIGYISEQQFRWLEQDLAHVKPGSTVVVSVHIPINTGAKRREGLAEEPAWAVVSNRAELYRLLRPFRAHIMSGHTHSNEKVFEGENIIEHVHGTVCGAWWTGPICYDGTPNGYGVYEVNGSEISWYYKSVGFDRDYQMRIYPLGAVKEHPDSLAVNVWNWDPHWKVEWFEDEQFRGALTQAVSIDPLSVELHTGADKPAIRPWIEPQRTDHMFFAKPSANSKQITIQVTDRFDRVYKKQVSREEFTASR